MATKTFHLTFRQIFPLILAILRRFLAQYGRQPVAMIFSRYDIDRHERRERERVSEKEKIWKIKELR